MWAVAKDFGDGARLYYTGVNGNWSSDRRRAARWVDRRDAWEAIKLNGYVGRARTVFLNDGLTAIGNQVVHEEQQVPVQ